MPTGSKLVGALAFFAVGWYVALQAVAGFPEGITGPYFPVSIALIGLVNGWMVSGSRAGEGFVAAISNGLRTALQIAFFSLMYYALVEMFTRSARLSYSGFGEAVIAALDLFLEYASDTATVEVWGALFVGGILGGFVTELAARSWR